MTFKKKNKKGISPLIAGAAGVVAGAAGYAMLKDQKTRENLMELAGEMKDKAREYVTPETKTKLKKAAEHSKKNINKLAN